MTPAERARRLAGWMPIRIHWEQGYPLVSWCFLGAERFLEPFFEDTIERRLRLPFALLFQQETTLDELVELQTFQPGVKPTGFIFHMSRCGSTLVSQLLAALPQNIVISEAGPIDAVLRANWRNPQITDAQRIAWLRALLSAYARPRQGETGFYVKLDSWHILELPLIQQAFPDVPWIFLYREPIQVLVSHQRQRGGQMVHGLLPPQWLGLDRYSMGDVSLDEYTARVLARICTAALQFQNDRGRLINYSQLPAATWGEIAAHFGIHFSPADQAAMQRAAHFDAKNPSMNFAADSTTKEQAASAELRRLADQWLSPLHQQLEARRALQTALYSESPNQLAQMLEE